MSESLTSQPPSSVTVTTTARLHFGFLDPSGRGAQPFGSFGLSLDQPCTRLTLQSAEAEHASGPEADRAARYLETIAESCGVDRAYRLHMEAAIPSHAGLGSGTQLALAVGSAFAAVEGLDLSPLEIAGRLGRGARSGIGIATFEAGGAVLDSGPRNGALPALVARVPFPENWRVLLVFDPETKGLDGADEIAAFEALPAFPNAEQADLRARIVDRALPALEACDFAAFCAEVGHLQERMGAYFAPLQGGPYTSPHVATVLESLRADGVIGLGQSSWGPTGFAFAASEGAGEKLLAAARDRDESGVLRFTLARGRNEGAEIAPT
ncbi:MAG: GHMP family kinase ATP-binding protein [Methyloceanibacter sp.]|uniref:GHMP family kinase ATP-binding protein n=1 Tax=Methyloceanibacter sp. TaxID=1965321 RepID=UPI003EE3CE61